MFEHFTFVAVVYNNFTDTLDFCQSLAAMDYPRNSISCVVVDNSNNDAIKKNIDSLNHNFEFVEILRPLTNLGYFGAFNFFFESELFNKQSTVVLCNNDLVFDNNFCQNYSNGKYKEDVFVVCPDVVTIDGIHQNPHVLKPWGRLARTRLDLYFSHYYVACLLRLVQRSLRMVTKPCRKLNESGACYLHMGIGACYVLLPRFFNEFSKLDFPYFLYGEEAYLTKQVHSAGGKLYFDPDLKVIHKESATLSKLPSRVTYEFGREGYWEYRSFY